MHPNKPLERGLDTETTELDSLSVANSTKKEIMASLDSQGIDYKSSMTKAELLALV